MPKKLSFRQMLYLPFYVPPTATGEQQARILFLRWWPAATLSLPILIYLFLGEALAIRMFFALLISGLIALTVDSINSLRKKP